MAHGKAVEIDNDIRGYAFVPPWVIQDTRLKHRDYRVLCAFLTFGGLDDIYPSNEELGKRSGMSADSASQSKRQLLKIGYISQYKRTDSNGKQLSNGYKIHLRYDQHKDAIEPYEKLTPNETLPPNETLDDTPNKTYPKVNVVKKKKDSDVDKPVAQPPKKPKPKKARVQDNPDYQKYKQVIVDAMKANRLPAVFGTMEVKIITAVFNERNKFYMPLDDIPRYMQFIASQDYLTNVTANILRSERMRAQFKAQQQTTTTTQSNRYKAI